ncbi:MAG: hypothetical protein EBU81_07775 [Proteobacteria bacterium]|nr:hypothetical protein [Pseudomonadota bacterium]
MIPLTSERLTSMVAEPNTTSAMLKPTLPPMRNFGSVGPSATRTAATGACRQSSTPPPGTEVWLSFNTRSLPMIFTASTPCN